MNTKELTDQYLLANYARYPIEFSHGEGSWVYDTEGNKYLDFAAGVAVNSLGHCAEAVVTALEKQSKQLIHCTNLYYIKNQAQLAHILVRDIMQRPGKCFFCNSGAEANEALIKFSRRYAKKKGIDNPEIITFTNSFHGRTMATLSATGQDKIKTGFEPLLSGFKHCEYNDLEELQSAVNQNTVAIMLETVQGEGGINVATKDFLLGIGAICKEKNILLLLDDIQAGIGRTGDLCSWKSILGENSDFQPDLVSWAKGLGGGVPIGAVWISDQDNFPELLQAGSHGTTYGGSPLMTAVSAAVLEDIINKCLTDNVKARSAQIIEGVQNLNSKLIKSVKGLGLMLGLELDLEQVQAMDGYDSEILPSVFIVRKLMDIGLLTVQAGTDVVRFLPPLNISEQEAEEALAKLGQVMLA